MIFIPDPKPLRREKKKPGGIKKRPRIDQSKYEQVRSQFLAEQPLCQCGCGGRSTEVHHKKGRTGSLLYDVRYFMAVTNACHVEIEANPAHSYEMGYMLQRTGGGDTLTGEHTLKEL